MLVDGYNIIFAWDKLKKTAGEVLEEARIQLLDILSDYKGFTGYEIIVVFDAHMVKDSMGVEEVYNGNIKAVFTKEFETADNYIEKLATVLSKENKVRVATSDGLEQIIILGKGAQRISANDLLIEIRHAKKKQKEKYAENRPLKTNMLSDNLSPELRAQLESMRRQKG